MLSRVATAAKLRAMMPLKITSCFHCTVKNRVSMSRRARLVIPPSLAPGTGLPARRRSCRAVASRAALMMVCLAANTTAQAQTLPIPTVMTREIVARDDNAKNDGASGGASGGGAVVSRSLPVLRATPSVLGSAGVVTLSFAANVADSPATVRLHVRLFEANRAARVADADRDFTRAGDVYQASFNLDAEPGAYEFRVMSDNRPRVVVSQAAPLLVAGVQRESGWWVLNGSPFVASSFFAPGPVENRAQVAPAAPLFVSGLKRDLNPKAKKNRVSIRVAPQTFHGQTLFLPPLGEIIKSDPATMRGYITRLLSDAKAVGERNLLGFSLPAGTTNNALSPIAARNAMVQLRAIMNDLAPEAALILRVDLLSNGAQAARDIDSCAALCDAVVLSVSSPYGSAWPLKVARRVAEEQPNYDLPIFVRVAPRRKSNIYQGGIIYDLDPDDLSFDDEIVTKGPSTEVLDLWMSGATGIARNENRRASWEQIVNRNAPLFIGSATLEDIGMLPAPDFSKAAQSQAAQSQAAQSQAAQSQDASELYEALRDARRIPFLARLERRGKRELPESFAIRLGENISAATVERLRQAAKDGARIYIEGAPRHDENGRLASRSMSSLVGATIAPLPRASDEKTSDATPSTDAANERVGKRATMILQDGWMFGTGRGTRVEVEQSVVVSLLAPGVASAIKPERGLDKLLGPRVAARLQDGSPALVINPVGRGEVIWMPHRVIDGSTDASIQIDSETQAPSPTSGAQLDASSFDVLSLDAQSDNEQATVAQSPAKRAAKQDGAATARPVIEVATTPGASGATNIDRSANIDRSTARQRFYAAVASYVQPSLVSLRGINSQFAGIENVRVALRRSPKGTLLLALFNRGARPAAIAATVDGVAGVALDLATERALPFEVRGFQSEAGVVIPARGFVLVAFSQSLRALDEERNTPRLQARLR